MDNLLEKYFTGIISDAEKFELFRQIQKDPELKSAFIRMQNRHAYLNALVVKEEKVLSKSNISEKRIYKLHKSFSAIVKYAAVFVLIFMSGWLLYDKFHTEKLSSEILYTDIDVPKGQQIHLTLPDDTEIWLSSRSSLRIPNNFKKENRSVELNGEGFFSVSKNAEFPFIVKTQSYNIKVLGTKFNLFAYTENNSFEASLLEGSIEVINPKQPKENCFLKPNEKVVFQNGSLVKSRDIFHNEQNLGTGTFAFDNKTFLSLLNYMQVWFDVTFDIAPNVDTAQVVSGKFKQSDDIEHILVALQDVVHFRYKKVNDSNKIVIYK